MLSWWPWAKALHVVFAVAFLSGMTAGACVLAWWRSAPAPHWPAERRMLEAAARWHRRVTGPALIGAWLLGLALASRGGWMGTPWLTAKLGLVVLLSAAHGGMSGLMRRASQGQGPRAGTVVRVAVPVLWGAVVGIVVLVVVKPG